MAGPRRAGGSAGVERIIALQVKAPPGVAASFASLDLGPADGRHPPPLSLRCRSQITAAGTPPQRRGGGQRSKASRTLGELCFTCHPTAVESSGAASPAAIAAYATPRA